MNKQNKILLGLLAFVVACTIGYALFSESITINGTATAKGDFDMSVTCQKGATETEKQKLYLLNEAGYSNDTCTVSNDTVTFSAELAYPTAARHFMVKMTNTGTIPAEIVVDNDMILNSQYCEYNKTTNTKGTCTDDSDSNTPFISQQNAFFIVNGVTMYGDSEGLEDLVVNDTEDGYIINPGDSIIVGMTAQWPSDKNSATDYYIGTGTFTYTFHQITAK